MGEIKIPAVKDQISALLRDHKTHLKSFLDKSISSDAEIDYEQEEVQSVLYALHFALGNVCTGSALEEIKTSNNYVNKVTWMFLNPQLVQLALVTVGSGQEPPSNLKPTIYIVVALVYDMLKNNEIEV